MKFLKILALVLTVCLLGAAFMACDSGESKSTETEAGTTASVSISLIVKDASGTKYEGSVTCNGTLGNAIEIFCAGEGFEGECFDAHDILSTVGELKAGDGKSFIAYYEDLGKNEAFESIKSQVVESGKTVVISLE